MDPIRVQLCCYSLTSTLYDARDCTNYTKTLVAERIKAAKQNK